MLDLTPEERLALALADPGAILPRRPGETDAQHAARAVAQAATAGLAAYERGIEEGIRQERERTIRRLLIDADGNHLYLSTGCLHNTPTGHAHCQSATGTNGEKTPATSKFSSAPCICAHHLTSEAT